MIKAKTQPAPELPDLFDNLWNNQPLSARDRLARYRHRYYVTYLREIQQLLRTAIEIDRKLFDAAGNSDRANALETLLANMTAVAHRAIDAKYFPITDDPGQLSRDLQQARKEEKDLLAGAWNPEAWNQ